MKILWQHGPQSVREMLTYYDEPKPHFNTVSTLVRILEEKGRVGHEACGGAFRYHALTGLAEIRSGALRQVVDSYFNGSYAEAVKDMLNDGKITPEELEKLVNESR